MELAKFRTYPHTKDPFCNTELVRLIVENLVGANDRVIDYANFEQISPEIESDNRLYTVTYAFDGDDKWGNSIGGLYFDEELIVVFHRHGRYGTECDCFLLSAPGFKTMYAYLLDLHLKKFNKELELEETLTFDIEKFSHLISEEKVATYQEGDEVWAFILENHLNYKNSHILARVQITQVSPHQSFRTYHGTQMDRSWIGKDYKKMGYTLGKNMGASVDEDMVLGKTSSIQNPPDNFYQNCNENGEYVGKLFTPDEALEYIRAFKESAN